MLGDFLVVVTDAIIGTMDAHNTLATRALSEDKIQKGFAKLIPDVIYKEMGVAQNIILINIINLPLIL
jgi:hypothetical protein